MISIGEMKSSVQSMEEVDVDLLGWKIIRNTEIKKHHVN